MLQIIIYCLKSVCRLFITGLISSIIWQGQKFLYKGGELTANTGQDLSFIEVFDHVFFEVHYSISKVQTYSLVVRGVIG